DAIPALEEAVLLLDRLHPGVHLGLPEVEDFLRADGPRALERLLEREDPGMGHEQVLLEVADRLEEGLDGLRGPLDHVLECRDPFEQVLVERDPLLRLAGALVDDAHAREHEQLRVAASAELLVVRVLRAAGLAVHRATLRLPRTRRSRARTYGRASRRRPSWRGAGSAGTADRRIRRGGRAGSPGTCRGR